VPIIHQIYNMVNKLLDKIKYGTTRSNRWPEVRKKHLGLYPTCAVCGSTKKVEVHHKKPFHLHPELELDPDNLVSLCEGKEFSSIICHLTFGHLGNYKDENESVDETVKAMKEIFDKKKSQSNINNKGE
jgi:5-methylcytosine-specific restriction protein A